MSSSTEQVPLVPLAGGVEIPQLGFGVFQVPPEDTTEITTLAFQAGYRHIDTAAYPRRCLISSAIRFGEVRGRRERGSNAAA